MPAFARSDTGSAGFSANPMTRPAASSSTTPPADGRSEWNTVKVAIGVMVPVGVDQGPQVEIREVVGVAGQEDLFTVDPVPVGERACRRCRAVPARRTCARPAARLRAGDVVAHHIGQVVEVDQDLVDAGAVERVEPDVEQRAGRRWPPCTSGWCR